MTLKTLEVLPTRPYDGATRTPSTDSNYQLVLADGVAETVLVPVGAKLVKITGSKDMWAAYSGTSTGAVAVIASTDADVGNGTELLPYSKGEHWRLLDKTSSTSTSAARSISVIQSSAGIANLQFWLD